jgi:integrase
MYVDKLRDADKPYYREARLFLDRLMTVVGQGIALPDITTELAREYQRRVVKGGASLAYADRHVAIAKAMFGYVAPHLPNPFKLVKMFRPDNTLVRMLTNEQEAELLRNARELKTKNMPWLPGIILVALRTGLRRNNILSLKWEQVNFDTRSIAVIQKGKRRLSVPIGASGIPLHFRFHDLRHHVATKLARNTRNPLIVQTILGHSALATTQKYMHVFNTDLTDAVDSLK